MIVLKWVIICATFVFFVLVGITWYALERSEVVDLVTQRHDQEPNQTNRRTTSAWFVRDANETLLEAGTPRNPWVLDIDQTNRLQLVSGDEVTLYCTTKDASPSAHQRIRTLMRAKYGWRDWWVDALFDVSQSALVRLTPC